ncbi:MAG: fibrobacter succinogenes major paralogous domain-containing protein, partial [Bacteroidota bacterium]
QIGNQCWTQSNLKVSKYRNGNNIYTGFSRSDWPNITSGAYAIFNNDPVNDGLYGKLYNHYAVTDSRGLCPTGWHVPSDGEWNILVKYLDPNADTVCANCTQSGAGGALKSTATQPTPGGWVSPNTGATNSSGFTAPPGGLRYDDGDFNVMTNGGYWWASSVLSASSAWFRSLDFNYSGIGRLDDVRTYGFSVRCCRD